MFFKYVIKLLQLFIMSCNKWKKVVESPTFDSLNWQRVAISKNGKHQTSVVRGGNIYISNNYGKTWDPVSQNFNFDWTNVAMTHDGQKQTAVVEGGNIYNSDDYGKTWIINETAPVAAWYSIALSKNGKYQTVCANGFFNYAFPDGYIYLSAD